MRDLERRIARLEEARTGGTPLLFVPLGSNTEAATAAWLAEHPDTSPGNMNFFISSVPEPGALPAGRRSRG